jgi:autotransporter-associated beta strand protein
MAKSCGKPVCAGRMWPVRRRDWTIVGRRVARLLTAGWLAAAWLCGPPVAGKDLDIRNFAVMPSGADYFILPVDPTMSWSLSQNIMGPPDLTYNATSSPDETPHTLQMQWDPVNSLADAQAGWSLVFGMDPDLTNHTITASIHPPGGFAGAANPQFIGVRSVTVALRDINNLIVGGWGFNADQLALPVVNDPLAANLQSLFNNAMQQVTINIGNGAAPGSAWIAGGAGGPRIAPNFLVAGQAGNLGVSKVAAIDFYENGILRGQIGIPGQPVPRLVNYWDHVFVAPTENWDGDIPSLTQTRLWNNGGANPGVNWVGDGLPAPIQTDVFGLTGGGAVDVGIGQSAGGIRVNNWANYNFMTSVAGSALNLSVVGVAANPTISLGDNVRDTYGCNYFTSGVRVDADLQLGASLLTIDLAGPTNGSLYLNGQIQGILVAGAPGVTLTASTANSDRSVWVTKNNVYPNTWQVNTNCSLHLVEGGRPGAGSIDLSDGTLVINANVQQNVANAVNVPGSGANVHGWVFADRSYQTNPLDGTIGYNPFTGALAFGPHSLGPITVGPGQGQLNNAAIHFGADNGRNFSTNQMTLVAGPPAYCSVAVINGDLRSGRAGSVRLTGPNRLQEVVVTTTVNQLLDAACPLLVKDGSGVLEIVNDGASNKQINYGVLRYSGVNGPGPGQILLNRLNPLGAPNVYSTGVGVGTILPMPLFTVPPVPAIITGQSGAFDIDVQNYNLPINQNYNDAAGKPIAIRTGSSGSGSINFPVGGITPFIAQPPSKNTYYFGGGGGTLVVNAVLTDATPNNPGDNFDMGTSGQLLPGRVTLTQQNMYTGPTLVWAGTLYLNGQGPMAGNEVAACSGTSTQTQSTLIDTGGNYTSVLNGLWNGPGQLLLNPNVNYNFGINGLVLDGGAVGWTNNVAVPQVVPPWVPVGWAHYSVYPLSTLYQSRIAAPNPLATFILHLGGEYSSGTMTLNWQITDQIDNRTPPPVTTPVALVKSGIYSTLDLTGAPAAGNTYTGGTAILGGEIKINKANQLGPGPIVVADSGILHIVPPVGPALQFNQILRVANGPFARSSQVQVDGGANNVALFANFFEADARQSILEKTGGGTLVLMPNAAYTPHDPGNTWGLKLTAGLVRLNQCPYAGPNTDLTGYLVTNGGNLDLLNGIANGLPLPFNSPNYGFGALVSFQGTSSTLGINPQEVLRINGSGSGVWEGTVILNGQDARQQGDVNSTYGNFVLASSPNGADTRGDGTLDARSGIVTFQLNPLAANYLIPQSNAFTLALDGKGATAVWWQGVGDAAHNLYGNLLINQTNPNPNVWPSIPRIQGQTILGTGLMDWKGTLEKVGAAGASSWTTDLVINRDLGAPVKVDVNGATLQISAGNCFVGGRGDPFTDTANPARHVIIANNSRFFITEGTKHVKSIAGTGNTTVYAGATLLVGSDGPVTQANLTVNGAADVGAVTVSSLTSVGDGINPASLSAISIVSDTLTIGAGSTVTIRETTSGATAAVPEPGTWALLIAGAMCLLPLVRRLRK